MTSIISTSEVYTGANRTAESHSSVLNCKRRVVDAAEDPHDIAGDQDISIADLFVALYPLI